MCQALHWILGTQETECYRKKHSPSLRREERQERRQVQDSDHSICILMRCIIPLCTERPWLVDSSVGNPGEDQTNGSGRRLEKEEWKMDMKTEKTESMKFQCETKCASLWEGRKFSLTKTDPTCLSVGKLRWRDWESKERLNGTDLLQARIRALDFILRRKSNYWMIFRSVHFKNRFL